MRKYQKEDGEKAIQFVECLSNMAVVGEESSFYRKEWIALVDRGGLYHVNDGAYTFFKQKPGVYFHIIWPIQLLLVMPCSRL